MAYRNKSKQQDAARDHYERHKPVYKERAKKHRRKMTRILKAYVLGNLQGHPCIDCGEPDPIVLEFDHRDRKVKLFAIGEMLNGAVGLAKLQAEIAKCDVRCANCHRRKTYLAGEYAPVSDDETEGDDGLPDLPLFSLTR